MLRPNRPSPMGPIPTRAVTAEPARESFSRRATCLERTLKAGRVPGGEQLLRVRAGTPRAAHLGRNGQIHIHLAIRRPGMACAAAGCGGLSCIEHSNWSRD